MPGQEECASTVVNRLHCAAYFLLCFVDLLRYSAGFAFWLLLFRCFDSLLIGAVAWLRHTSPLWSSLVGVEVVRAVMEEEPFHYASVNDPITSRSPVVAGQTECASIAINRLHCAVEMARITKNASACCTAPHSNTTQFTLHRAAPQVKYPLNFH